MAAHVERSRVQECRLRAVRPDRQGAVQRAEARGPRRPAAGRAHGRGARRRGGHVGREHLSPPAGAQARPARGERASRSAHRLSPRRPGGRRCPACGPCPGRAPPLGDRARDRRVPGRPRGHGSRGRGRTARASRARRLCRARRATFGGVRSGSPRRRDLHAARAARAAPRRAVQRQANRRLLPRPLLRARGERRGDAAPPRLRRGARVREHRGLARARPRCDRAMAEGSHP